MAGRRPLSPYTGAAHVTAPRPALTHVALYLDLLGFSLVFFLSPRVPLSVPRHVPLSRSPRLLRTVTLPSGQVRGGELCSTSLGTSLYIKCPQLLCMRDLSLLPIYLVIHSFVRSFNHWCQHGLTDIMYFVLCIGFIPTLSYVFGPSNCCSCGHW